MEDTKLSIESEQNDETGEEISVPVINKRISIRLAEKLSGLLSKEGLALYIGKMPRAVVEMAKTEKIPAFYMTDPLKSGGKAELWVNRREWDKHAAQLVDEAPEEWHEWKNHISCVKSSKKESRV